MQLFHKIAQLRSGQARTEPSLGAQVLSAWSLEPCHVWQLNGSSPASRWPFRVETQLFESIPEKEIL